MNNNLIKFPQYRKYKNNLSYFKIIDERIFIEVQVIGSKYFVNQVEAKQFPEILFVKDLLLNFNDLVLEISAVEFESLLKKAQM
ncbi:MAG: hypothetical protein JSU07_12635 [Bacteroidetes bacterium]|nr:hypothetical protein [Bacteroidota bacterium]